MTLALPFQDTYRHLPAGFFTRLDPAPVAAPALVHLHAPLATTLGLDADVLLDQFSVQGGKPAKVRSKVEPIEQPTRIMQSANRSDGLRQLAGQLGMQDVRNGGTLLPLIVGIVVLLIVIGLFYFLTHRG